MELFIHKNDYKYNFFKFNIVFILRQIQRLNFFSKLTT